LPHEIIAPRNRRFAKAMRQDMTRDELRLWQHLRKPGLEGLRFRRQAPIGAYIVDFFCPERKLIVEVDGDQHGFEAGEAHDLQRDAWLRDRGYRVLRFSNRDVMTNLNGVCDTIIAAAAERQRDTRWTQEAPP
jgi:very-short-patch-repair endonuclease